MESPSDGKGFVNRRSTVQIRPLAPVFYRITKASTGHSPGRLSSSIGLFWSQSVVIIKGILSAELIAYSEKCVAPGKPAMRSPC